MSVRLEPLLDFSDNSVAVSDLLRSGQPVFGELARDCRPDRVGRQAASDPLALQIDESAQASVAGIVRAVAKGAQQRRFSKLAATVDKARTVRIQQLTQLVVP